MEGGSNMVSQNIAEQIGSAAFFMLGARGSLLGSDNSLQFDVKGSRACSRIIVTLDTSDTYTVQFWKGKGLNIRKVGEQSFVYADSLKTTIEGFTGLRMSL
jgi:hypothetical protein